MPAGGGIWGTNRRLFDVSYYWMDIPKLEAKIKELQVELEKEKWAANRAAIEIHIDRCKRLIIEQKGGRRA